MAYGKVATWLQDELQNMRDSGLFKDEKVIKTAQGPYVDTLDGETINFCANNYLGLADSAEVEQAVEDGLRSHGFGMASVRFICGTQDIHKTLEQRLTEFMGTEDTILYTSCFDANTGLFETILSAEDAIISDALNHASIIDGIRLCKAKRYRYRNSDMTDLEAQLREADAAGARFKLIVTDGVFSMDGYIANLAMMCDLADQYDALVMVDDSHAVGFMGARGRGTHEHCGVMDRVDIITGTLGKALGGASGGYTSGRQDIIELLRQRSRPYLFSNSVAPVIVATSLKVLDMLESSDELRDRLLSNTRCFRHRMGDAGFDILPGEHPIVPIMLGDAVVATRFADAMLERGVYVIGFSFPVVPEGKARIRVQLSAAHSPEDLDFAINAFTAVKGEMGL